MTDEPQRARLPISTTATFPPCLWSLRIFLSLPGSRITIFYRDASSTLLQLVHQRLNFTYPRSHAFRYGRHNKNISLMNRTRDFRTSRCTRLPTRPLGRRGKRATSCFHYIINPKRFIQKAVNGLCCCCCSCFACLAFFTFISQQPWWHHK